MTNEVNKDAETQEQAPELNAMAQLEQLASSIARRLPDDRKQAMHHKMLGDELNQFIKKVHYINTLFGGMSESALIGVVVDELFYEVKLTTKEFGSTAEANDYAQQRHEQVDQERAG